MKKIVCIVAFFTIIFLSCNKKESSFEIKNKYFNNGNVDVLVYNNDYSIGKQGGVEIIQHGERVATCGDLRMEPLENEILAPFPEIVSKIIDSNKKFILVNSEFKHIDLKYSVKVFSENNEIKINVSLNKPISKENEGDVFFNLELYPVSYYGKSWQMDTIIGYFPRQANGFVEIGKHNQVELTPMAIGKKLVVSSEDPLTKIEINSTDQNLQLLDGRNRNQENWFLIRSIIPVGRTKNALEWTIKINNISDWKRNPVIAYSQIGYHSNQEKRAIIELDKKEEKLEKIILEKINMDGSTQLIKESVLKEPKDFYRYKYAKFDFSEIKETGLYRLKYKSIVTPVFQISKDIYSRNVWEPCLLTTFPTQMCHMRVNDRLDVIHGLSHDDDAQEAPINHEHFDGYRQGSETQTRYKPFEHIPGLNQGGWFDAGDYDIVTTRNAFTIWLLANLYEEFNIAIDQTSIDFNAKVTTCFKPDGKPDVLQQMEHGLILLLQYYRISGHSFKGIIERDLHQYVHQGEASTITDNLVYDSKLKPGQRTATTSAVNDDRFVFTEKTIADQLACASAFAISGRVLKQYNPQLASECVKWAEIIWVEEKNNKEKKYIGKLAEVAVELLLTTQKAEYKEYLLTESENILSDIYNIRTLTRVSSILKKDSKWNLLYINAINNFKKKYEDEIAKCPFDVEFHKYQYRNPEEPEESKTWGTANDIMNDAWRNYFIVKNHSDIFPISYVSNGLDYAMGCHPLSNTPIVAGVGTKPLVQNFCFDRAVFSYLPGSVVFAPALIRPDFLEFKEPFSFIWQQTEFVISGSAEFIYLVKASEKLLNKKN